MRRLLKQAVGIDVAQKELVVSIGRMYDDLKPEVYGYHTFPNTAKGFGRLVVWVAKQTDVTPSVAYVLEPTGVYHEKLAHFLADLEQDVYLVLPNKIHSFHGTLTIKTETDKTASETIVRFALERRLDRWQRPRPIFKKLLQLTREREKLMRFRTQYKNSLHAEKHQAEPSDGCLKRLQEKISLLNEQETAIRGEIDALLDGDQVLKKNVQNICTIPGVGVLTAVIVLGETNGFELVRNTRQLVSYAGLDIKEKLSGISVKRRPRISKRGNSYLRKSMHCPALNAIRYNEQFKTIYTQLVTKHGVKMKAIVAIQRKLLALVYVLHKTGRPFDKDKLRSVYLDISDPSTAKTTDSAEQP